MHMIAHQHERMQIDAEPSRVTRQELEVVQTIVITEEADATIVAALDDVLRDIRQIDSATARHDEENAVGDQLWPPTHFKHIAFCPNSL